MAKKTTPQVPENPLQRIALCMSGGGYRAATFQLGMMSYLHSVKFNNGTLLEKIKAISTVSGGTIIGVYYAAMVQEGRPFEEIYTNFTEWITKTDLVKAGLEKISPNGTWTYPYKRKNIINAFAELYDQTLLDGRTMSVFDDLNKSHLDYVCFNGTEFLRGYRFRFQAGKEVNIFGSNDVRISKKHHSDFRLGDIMAASSGFSGGFEPISIPDDFMPADSETHKDLTEKLNKKGGPIGIMDGGIHDNQGISSIETYQDFVKVKDFDLILFSDVSSPYLTRFDFTETKSDDIREKTLNDFQKEYHTTKLWVIYGHIVVILLGLFFAVISDFKNTMLAGIGYAIMALGIGGLLVLRALQRKAIKQLNNLHGYFKKKVPVYFLERFGAFDYKNSKLKDLEVLALDRFNSLKLLLPDVFLKQVRRLHYNRIFSDEKYTYRRSACLIKELTEVDFGKKTYDNKDPRKQGDYTFMQKHDLGFEGESQEEVIGKKMLEYTTSAASFGTTLWFTDNDQLDHKLKALLISGQVGCCQDLLIYLSRIIFTENNGFDALDEPTKTSLTQLHTSMMADWERFKKEPEHLYNSLK